MPNDLPAQGGADFRGLRLDAYSLDLPDGSRIAAERPDDREALDEALASGAPDAASVVQGTIEDQAGALAATVRRFLLLPEWSGTQRVLVGGGLRRTGEVAIGRAAMLLRPEGVRLAPIRHDPHEAGLIGAARLLPDAELAAADAVLTADLGGTSFRAGVVLPRLGVAPDLAAAGLWRSRIWRHAGTKVDRAAAIGALAGLLGDLAGEAGAAGLSLAPVVAVAVPGVVDPDGRILRGAGRLPGDWHTAEFHLPSALARLLPLEGGGHPAVVLHNDTVAQGLSEAPFVRDVARWGVLTIGAGLGNARFTNLPMR